MEENCTMFQSMTGFGKASALSRHKKIDAEIRTLNSKQLDLNLHLPFVYRELEAEIRILITPILVRGKVDIFISIPGNEGMTKPLLNKELAREYYRQLKELGKTIKEKKGAYLPLMLNMPGLFRAEEAVSGEELKTVLDLIKKAAGLVVKFRQKEGKALKKDIEVHLSAIENRETEIAKLDSARTDKQRQRLMTKLNELGEAQRIDRNRFEQEIIYYIEKLDINEERTRLRTHCKYFRETMEEESGGRKLGFIVQEIGREINTIGSKANDGSIQKLVVEMKDELEKMKEQLFNVL